ncbi:hypothetical protein C8R43DRAFT_948827 [Mycena crocata]|nr:hypothetical protein C8R43DRAFT_948827 [Mycena crocata]
MNTHPTSTASKQANSVRILKSFTPYLVKDLLPVYNIFNPQCIKRPRLHSGYDARLGSTYILGGLGTEYSVNLIVSAVDGLYPAGPVPVPPDSGHLLDRGAHGVRWWLSTLEVSPTTNRTESRQLRYLWNITQVPVGQREYPPFGPRAASALLFDGPRRSERRIPGRRHVYLAPLVEPFMEAQLRVFAPVPYPADGDPAKTAMEAEGALAATKEQDATEESDIPMQGYGNGVQGAAGQKCDVGTNSNRGNIAGIPKWIICLHSATVCHPQIQSRTLPPEIDTGSYTPSTQASRASPRRTRIQFGTELGSVADAATSHWRSFRFPYFRSIRTALWSFFVFRPSASVDFSFKSNFQC